MNFLYCPIISFPDLSIHKNKSMHELSIVLGIIDIADQYTRDAGASGVEEIDLEIGELSGVDPAALDFAWDLAIKNTVLENAVRKINSIAGRAKCMDCDSEFKIGHYTDPCPVCGKHLLSIVQGKEMRVKSLVVSG